MERRRFGWGVAAGLFMGLVLLWARQAGAQGGSAEALNVPSLQALGKVPELDEPLKEFRTGNVVGALQLLRAAAKKNPELPPPQVILAAWLAEVNQPGMARTALETATLEVPDDPEPYLILADLALRDRQVAEASLLLGKGYDLLAGTRISPKRAAVLKRRALVALATLADSRRDWMQAQKYLESLLAADPKNASAVEQLGRVLFQLKKPEEALAKLQEAAKLDPANILAPEATLAQLYQQSGDKENAAKWMVAAIKANPRDARVRRVAAQWSLEIGRLDQAEEQAKAALQLDPDSPLSLTVRGTVAMVRKDYKTAEECFGKAHLLAPGNFAALSNLALTLAEEESPAKRRLALEYAQILSRLFPDQADAAGALGWTLYKLGRVDEAELVLRKAVSAPSVSRDTLYFYARVLTDRGRKEEALKLLEAALAAKPSASFLRRADAEALLGDLQK